MVDLVFIRFGKNLIGIYSILFKKKQNKTNTNTIFFIVCFANHKMHRHFFIG